VGAGQKGRGCGVRSLPAELASKARSSGMIRGVIRANLDVMTVFYDHVSQGIYIIAISGGCFNIDKTMIKKGKTNEPMISTNDFILVLVSLNIDSFETTSKEGGKVSWDQTTSIELGVERSCGINFVRR
jgi:hypothetical protein